MSMSGNEPLQPVQSDVALSVQLTTGLAAAVAPVAPALLPCDDGPAGVLFSLSSRLSPLASDMSAACSTKICYVLNVGGFGTWVPFTDL